MSAKKRSRKRPRPKIVKLAGIHDAARRGEAFETTVRAFEGVGRWERHLEDAVWQGPIFDPEHTRVALAPGPGKKKQGRVVSVVVMTPRMMRFGNVQVPAMTVGPVGTHDKHRRRGYGLAAMNDASRYMKEEGFLVAYLGGIPDYYHRFGYYPFMARSTVKFSRARARAESHPGKLRRMKRSDLPAVRRIYDEATSHRTCAAARGGDVWEWLLEYGTRTWLFPDPKVVVDKRGRPCGYVTVHAGRGFNIREVVVRQEEAACRAALGAISGEAKRREVGDIELPLPWDDLLAVLLRQYVGGEFRLRTHPTGGALLKIVDFPELARRLQPAFTERWRAAQSFGGDGRAALPRLRFTLASELGKVEFTTARGGVKVGRAAGAAGGAPRVQVPQRWLSGLFTGYHSVRSMASRKGVVIPPELAPALEILFPAGWPFVHQGDDY